jgi:hypothetical protein
MEQTVHWVRSIDPPERLALTFHSIAERNPSMEPCPEQPLSSLTAPRIHCRTVDLQALH